MLNEYMDVIAARLAEKLTALTPPAAREKRLFDLSEAAHYLGRSPNALKMMFHHAKLPGTKIDGKLQFDKRVLDKLIDDCTYFANDHRT